MEAVAKFSKEKLLLIFLFLLIYFINSKAGIEFKFILLLVLSMSFVFFKVRLYNSLLVISLPLLIIFIVAMFSAILNFPDLYNFVKDCVHIMMPLFGITLGFYITKSLNNKSKIFKIIILYCFISAIIHIITVFVNIDGEWSTRYIRSLGGKGSIIEAFGYSIFIVFFKRKKYQIFSKRFGYWYIIVATVSILLYLSRTTFTAIILFLISFYGLTQLNRKQIIYFFGFFLFSVVFMVSLQFMNIERNSTGIESFLYKIKIAPSEIFNSDIDIDDHKQLWDKWRAYEVKMAFNTIKKDGNALSYVTGMGLGSQVDLGFEAPLSKEKMRYIPHLHNGYAYVFFKSGIVGVMVLVFWMLYLYGFIYRRTIIPEKIMLYRMVSGIGLYLIFSTLVITGIYNLGVILSLLLGLILGLASCNGILFPKAKE